MEPTTVQNHIEKTEGVCGGKPCVKGTRIRVWDVHVWHNLQGKRPEEISAEFPQVSVADVHAALAYFLDHREEIEREMKAADDLVARLETEQGATRFSRLRDGLRDATHLKQSNDDQVSP